MAQTQLDRIESKVDHISELLHGDGSESMPGLKIQVDRLTQASHRRSWLARTSFGVALAALLTAIAKHINI